MNDWENFIETLLPVEEDFYGQINMKDITDPDYAQAAIVCKGFQIKNLGEYHDCWLMYLKTFKICVLKYMHFILHLPCTRIGLAWQATLTQFNMGIFRAAQAQGVAKMALIPILMMSAKFATIGLFRIKISFLRCGLGSSSIIWDLHYVWPLNFTPVWQQG